MRPAAFLLGAVALPVAAAAQTTTDSVPDGSATPGWLGRRISAQYQLLAEAQYNWSRLRDDSRVNPDNAGRLAHRDDEVRLFPSADLTIGPAKLRGDVRASWTETPPAPHAARHPFDAEVQELRAGFSLGSAVYVVAGRQRLGWGSGTMWNPARVEPQKDPLRPGNRLRGADAARVELTHGTSSLNVLVLPAQLGQPASTAARVEGTVHGVALAGSVIAPATSAWRVGYDASLARDRFTLHLEGTARGRSLRPSVDSLGTLTPRADGGLAGLYHNVVVGGMLVPAPSLYVVAEYQYQSDYASATEDSLFVRFLPRNGQLYDPIGRGRHRLFAQIRRASMSGSAVSVLGFADLVTHQTIVAPTVELARGGLSLSVAPYLYTDRAPVSVYRARLQTVLSAYF